MIFRRLPRGLELSRAAHVAIDGLEELKYNASEPFQEREFGIEVDYSFLYQMRRVLSSEEDPCGHQAVGKLCYDHWNQRKRSPAISVLYNLVDPFQITRAFRFRKVLMRGGVSKRDCFSIGELMQIHKSNTARKETSFLVENNIARVLKVLRADGQKLI